MHLNEERLIDDFQRPITYLRLSVTDRCNLRCVYCRPARSIAMLRHSEVLRHEEFLRLVRIAARLGVSKVRVTGGEPLVRRGVIDFLSALTEIQGLSDISLTTNGVMLKNHLSEIRNAGIRRLNISLDTLDSRKFHNITGFDRFDEVWEAILLAHEMGFSPIKINVVALKGINDAELADLAGLSFKYPFHVRFIEYMPVGSSITTFAQHLPVEKIMDRVQVLGRLIPEPHKASDGPADRFRFEGAMGQIGIIGAISHRFCHCCNRLRLTASGQLRPCLFSNNFLDIRAALRKGMLDEDLAEIFKAAVRMKPRNHQVETDRWHQVGAIMSSVGG